MSEVVRLLIGIAMVLVALFGVWLIVELFHDSITRSLRKRP
jgi:hypothetical protein